MAQFLLSERFGTGADGAASLTTSTDATANTTAVATLASKSLTLGAGTGFAAGNLVLIHQTRNGGTGPGNWELNKINNLVGTTATLKYATSFAYDTTAQIYLLKQYSSLNIASGQTITGRAWTGSIGGIFAAICNGPITIAGALTAAGATGGTATTGNTTVTNGGGFRGGAGQRAIADSHVNSTCGEGTGGASSITQTANGNGGGAATFNNSSIARYGAGGGNGAAGGSTDPATGGLAVGLASLVVLDLGGGGGGGGRGESAGNGVGGGGNGGGIILLIAPSITITGSISANGGNGGSDGGAGGGGGAGGSILLKSRTLVLGTNLITATGGTGGGGTGTGAVGRIHADYNLSLSGSTNPSLDSAVGNFSYPFFGGMM